MDRWPRHSARQPRWGSGGHYLGPRLLQTEWGRHKDRLQLVSHRFCGPGPTVGISDAAQIAVARGNILSASSHGWHPCSSVQACKTRRCWGVERNGDGAPGVRFCRHGGILSILDRGHGLVRQCWLRHGHQQAGVRSWNSEPSSRRNIRQISR